MKYAVNYAMLNLVGNKRVGGRRMEKKPKGNGVMREWIGDASYESYKSVLKLVLGICMSVYSCSAMIEGIVNLSIDSHLLEGIIEIVIHLIVGLLAIGIQASLWVTLVFVLIEKLGKGPINIEFKTKEGAINDKSKKSISIGDSLFSLVMILIFTALLYYVPQLIGWYEKDINGLILVEPVFVIERLQTYLPIIVALAGFEVMICLYQIVRPYWNRPLAWIKVVYDVLSISLVIRILRDHTLFNPGFFEKLEDLMGISLENILPNGITIIIIVLIGATILETVMHFYKSNL